MSIEQTLSKNMQEIFGKNRDKILESIELLYWELLPEVDYYLEEHMDDLETACRCAILDASWETPYYFLFVQDMIEETDKVLRELGQSTGGGTTFHDYAECIEDHVRVDAPKKLMKLWINENPGRVR